LGAARGRHAVRRYGDRVLSFELDSPDLSADQVRERAQNGEPLDDLVPGPVAETIRELGLYRGYTDSAVEKDPKSH
jgi:nicotinic acid mononucleotide adenylyltransferase